jgi:transposase
VTTKTEQNNGIAMFNTGNEGSVLDPLLFIMYINDIAEKLISPTRLFADYTYFSYSNRDDLQIKTVIDHDLEELDEWPKK